MLALDLSPTGSHPIQWPDEALETDSIASPFLVLNRPVLDSLGSSELAASPTLQRFAPAWSELLSRAVEEPGLICEAYTRFHGYSLGNRFAALLQCEMRGLEPGPLNSFNGWRKLGYAVKVIFP